MNEQEPARLGSTDLIERIHQAYASGDELDLGGAVIQARAIRDLLVEAPKVGTTTARTNGAGDPWGLRIVSAVINGPLHLDNASLKQAISIRNSIFRHHVYFRDARFDRKLDLSGSSLATLYLQNAEIAGDLSLSGVTLREADQAGCSLVADHVQVHGNATLEGLSTVAGGLTLVSAMISGQLNLRRAVLNGADNQRYALIGDHLNVDGGVFMDDRFIAQGALRIPRSSISGPLALSGATIDGEDAEGFSVNGDDMVVEGDCFMNAQFHSKGAIRLFGAQILGSLRMDEATIDGSDEDGEALLADSLDVRRDVVMSKCSSDGGIRIPDARIGGILNFEGARIGHSHQETNSLIGDRITVAGSAFFDEAFQSTGILRIVGARIAGTLRVDLRLCHRPAPPILALNLRGTSVGELLLQIDFDKCPQCEPSKAGKRNTPTRHPSISLENCTYLNRPDPEIGSIDAWLIMLRTHAAHYEPSAYQQLAAVHRTAGHDRDSGRILMAQQDHRRSSLLRPVHGDRIGRRISLFASRTGLVIWKVTLGYGYRPRRALAWLAILLTCAGLLVALATHIQADSQIPDRPVAYRPTNTGAGTLEEYCSPAEAAGLAVRIAIPVIANIAQGSCLINTATVAGSYIAIASIALQTLAWILGALTIAAVATAIRRVT